MPRLESSLGYSTDVSIFVHFLHLSHFILLSVVLIWNNYASAVWDPYLCKDIDLLDKTQTFALRVCLKNWSLSSDILHSQLNLPSLADRRCIFKLCHLYKIVKNLEDFCSPPISFKSQPYNTRHSNSLALCPIYAHSTQFHFSFFPHIISLWNSLSIMILLIHPL